METRDSPGQPQHPDPVASVRAAFGRAVNEVLPVLDTAHRDGLNHVALLASQPAERFFIGLAASHSTALAALGQLQECADEITAVLSAAPADEHATRLGSDRGESGNFLTADEIANMIARVVRAHDDDLTSKQLLIADLGYETTATGFAAATAFWKARVYVPDGVATATLADALSIGTTRRS